MIIESIKLINKEQLKHNIFILEFESSKIVKLAKPGQFINILLNNFTLGRPFSIFEITKHSLKIGVKTKGDGTKKLTSLSLNDKINAIGPLGNGFVKPTPSDKILIIGGGIGCFALFELAKQCEFCHILLGFKSADQIILKKEFEKLGNLSLCVEQNTTKAPKLVTEPLKNLIQTEHFNRIACCGPKPMMKAVFEIAKNFAVFCEVCLEERMACGIGACLGCQCLIKKNGQIKSKHVCCDGPVFNAKEVFFN